MNTTLPQIPKLAKHIARTLKGGEILALIGPLGSGKTAFTKTLGKELKIRQRITSPTFTLMNRYKFKKQKNLWLYHLDIYRLKNFKEVQALGLLEIWGEKNNVVVIEWADKIKKYLPKNSKNIYFKHLF